MADVYGSAKASILSSSSILPAEKLEWPPTEADLRRLYLREKRSAIEIAKIYGLRTKNPRSAPYLITYHLKRHGIERRNRVAELAKATSAVVIEWSSKYPPSGSSPADPTLEVEAILELLRLPNLSIKHLDQITKRRLCDVLQHLHHEQGLSLTDIALLIGNKTSGYASWVARQVGMKPREFEEARLKGIHKKVRKYERRPFDGTDEDKAYLLGIAHGDFHASRPFGDAIAVSTSTTHPALAELFTRLFSPFGHVYRYPRFKKETQTYEWNLQTILDKSFEFLLEARDKCRAWVLRKESTILSYLAGLVDAEGYIRIYANPRTIGIILSLWNTDVELLEFAHGCLSRLGFRPMKPYLDRPPGGVSSGFHIEMKKAYWRVFLARVEEAQSLLRLLPLQHKEKLEMKELALSVSKGGLYDVVAKRVLALRKSFHTEARLYTRLAEVEFLRSHQANSKAVLDQALPSAQEWTQGAGNSDSTAA